MLGLLRPRTKRRAPPGALVVYTAIFGHIPDELRPPGRVAPDPSVRYLCFTDRIDRSKRIGPWELGPPLWTHPDPRRMARYHKTLSHLVAPEAELTVWLDGNIQLRVDPWTLVERHLGDGLEVAAFKHRDRDCVYDELEACLRLEKDGAERMTHQVARYRAQGYPPRHGLAETGVLARRHSDRVREFNRSWWDEIEQGSVRDQLSFNFVLWRLGLDYDRFPGQSIRSPYVRYQRHR